MLVAKISIVQFAIVEPIVPQAVGVLTTPESGEENLALTYGDKVSISIVTGSLQALSRALSVASGIALTNDLPVAPRFFYRQATYTF